MIDPLQFLDCVVALTLGELHMDSPAAQALVLGTAAQESRLQYLVQLGNGPAREIFQMEPATACGSA